MCVFAIIAQVVHPPFRSSVRCKRTLTISFENTNSAQEKSAKVYIPKTTLRELRPRNERKKQGVRDSKPQ